MNAVVPQDEIYATVELLGFVADLCDAQPEELNVALCRFMGTYYPAHHLRAEVLEIADRLARSIGFADAAMERDQ